MHNVSTVESFAGWLPHPHHLAVAGKLLPQVGDGVGNNLLLRFLSIPLGYS